jgi:hypothetical protein
VPESKSLVIMKTPVSLVPVSVSCKQPLPLTPPLPGTLALPKTAVLAGKPDSKSAKKLPACAVARGPRAAKAAASRHILMGVILFIFTLSFLRFQAL